MTGALDRIDIRGPGGRDLRSKWAHGPRAYLGVKSAGFPYLFIVTGPGSPSVLSNVIPSLEQHVEFITDCIDHMRAKGLARIDPAQEAEDRWVAHVGEVAGGTLLFRAASLYMGANSPGKPRIVAKGYEGFTFA